MSVAEDEGAGRREDPHPWQHPQSRCQRAARLHPGRHDVRTRLSCLRCASGRLQLAQWMTSREHPLTARVMVNRVWHWLFGAGIVRTTDNFGSTGEAAQPS
jgi:hypothetical protein